MELTTTIPHHVSNYDDSLKFYFNDGKLADYTTDEVRKYARGRWFRKGSRGRDALYFDIERPDDELQTFGLLKQTLRCYGVEAEDITKAIGNGECFREVQGTPVYRQWSPPIIFDKEAGRLHVNLWRCPHKAIDGVTDEQVRPVLDALSYAYGHEP